MRDLVENLSQKASQWLKVLNRELSKACATGSLDGWDVAFLEVAETFEALALPLILAPVEESKTFRGLVAMCFTLGFFDEEEHSWFDLEVILQLYLNIC